MGGCSRRPALPWAIPTQEIWSFFGQHCGFCSLWDGPCPDPSRLRTVSLDLRGSLHLERRLEFPLPNPPIPCFSPKAAYQGLGSGAEVWGKSQEPEA